jgi:hypothetical protein
VSEIKPLNIRKGASEITETPDTQSVGHGPENRHYPSGAEPVAHACNPSYSGCRDQEDLGSKAAPGK